MPEENECLHEEEDVVTAIKDGACVLCLEDKIRLLQLHASVDPLALKMVQQENAVLWKVIALLGGRE